MLRLIHSDEFFTRMLTSLDLSLGVVLFLLITSDESIGKEGMLLFLL